MAEVQLPQTAPSQRGGVVTSAPDDDVIELHDIAALDDEDTELPSETLEARHQVQGHLLQLGEYLGGG